MQLYSPLLIMDWQTELFATSGLFQKLWATWVWTTEKMKPTLCLMAPTETREKNFDKANKASVSEMWMWFSNCWTYTLTDSFSGLLHLLWLIYLKKEWDADIGANTFVALSWRVKNNKPNDICVILFVVNNKIILKRLPIHLQLLENTKSYKSIKSLSSTILTCKKWLPSKCNTFLPILVCISTLCRKM